MWYESDATVAVISAVGALGVAYVTVKYKDVVIGKNKQVAPKDRMDTIFDGYESLIKQQQKDIDRKSTQLDQTQLIIERLQEELDKTKEIVKAQQAELEESREANKELIEQLSQMKKHYINPNADTTNKA